MFWGEAGGIVVKASVCRPVDRNIKNILIEDNIIDAQNSEHGIYDELVDKITVRRNRIICKGDPVVLSDCTNASLDL